MPKHKDQRVGVFVDVQNVYYSAKQFYHTKVNFAHILNRAVAGRRLIRAIAYVIKADIKEEENFFDALEKIGYDVRSKDLQIFFGGAKKGDWDVGIAMDIMRMASKLDVVVLVSGDGDFKDLLEHVKALGCRAEVVAFRKTASSRILGEADEFIDLDKELEKVLIKDNRAPVKKREFVPNREDNRPKKDFKEFKEFRREEREPASLLQKINMDQPDLNKNTREKIPLPKSPVPAVMPAAKEAQPLKEQPLSLARQPLLPLKQEEPQKKEAKESKEIKEKEEQKKRKAARGQKKEKQESMLKRVISKVTKKE